MLRSLKDLARTQIQSRDGEFGTTFDFYIDDLEWTVRYLVVDTGKWLPGKRVLISPVSIEGINDSPKSLHLALSEDQVRNAPDIDLEKTVSREKEEQLAQHYRWPVYWGPAIGILQPVGPRAHPLSDEDVDAEESESQVRSNLRSFKEVEGYHIEAIDDEIGHLDDLIVDVDTWEVIYAVVDTRNWLPGRKVLFSIRWIEKFDWEKELVHVDLTRDNVKNSPEFDPHAPVNRVYESQLFGYYGRPAYWE